MSTVRPTIQDERGLCVCVCGRKRSSPALKFLNPLKFATKARQFMINLYETALELAEHKLADK